jgi:hypothetical protein
MHGEVCLEGRLGCGVYQDVCKKVPLPVKATAKLCMTSPEVGKAMILPCPP